MTQPKQINKLRQKIRINLCVQDFLLCVYIWLINPVDLETKKYIKLEK